MNKEDFLPIWIKFSGWLEIVFGVFMALGMSPMMTNLGIDHVPFWSQMAGISLCFMGVILLYSARDIKQFIIVPIISSLYRFVIVIAEIYCFLTFYSTSPIIANILLVASFYDGGSAAFTLWLLWDLGYLKKD